LASASPAIHPRAGGSDGIGFRSDPTGSRSCAAEAGGRVVRGWLGVSPSR
jgi:hypothetical protein